jgi:hypothetical protein
MLISEANRLTLAKLYTGGNELIWDECLAFYLLVGSAVLAVVVVSSVKSELTFQMKTFPLYSGSTVSTADSFLGFSSALIEVTCCLAVKGAHGLHREDETLLGISCLRMFCNPTSFLGGWLH